MDLERAPAPDETTLCKFRHLLEAHELGGAMLEAVNRHLDSKGIRITTGTIVDATIIHAPSSTKNSAWERDPEMHQTRKGRQWYFRLKAHIGVDSKTGIVYSVHHGGIGGRQAYVARPAAWRRAQGVGRWKRPTRFLCGYQTPENSSGKVADICKCGRPTTATPILRSHGWRDIPKLNLNRESPDVIPLVGNSTVNDAAVSMNQPAQATRQ